MTGHLHHAKYVNGTEAVGSWHGQTLDRTISTKAHFACTPLELSLSSPNKRCSLGSRALGRLQDGGRNRMGQWPKKRLDVAVNTPFASGFSSMASHMSCQINAAAISRFVPLDYGAQRSLRALGVLSSPAGRPVAFKTGGRTHISITIESRSHRNFAPKYDQGPSG